VRILAWQGGLCGWNSYSQSSDLHRQLEGLRIPAAPENAMRLDGQTFELTIERGFNAVEYKWWPEPPKGWEPLGDLVNVMLGYTAGLPGSMIL